MLYHSTRSDLNSVDSAQAVLEGLAPDGGLYVPESLPAFDQAWETFEVTLKENVGAIVVGDQWIVKLDEDFTRIVTPQLKLSKDSQYRIYDVE